MIDFKLASINVRGLGDKTKCANILNWLIKNKVTVACLQETFLTEANENENCKQFNENGTLHSCLSNSAHSRGVSIYISGGFPEYKIINKTISENGRLILLNIKINHTNENYTIVSVYAPNHLKNRIDFFKRLKTWLKQHSIDENNIFVAGDLNCNLDENKDKSCKILKEVLNYNEIKDVFKNKHENDSGYTYIHPTDLNNRSRIDYIFTSINALKHIKLCEVLCCPTPDHKAVTISYSSTHNQHGKGYWKLNNSVLEEIDYKNIVKQEIQKTKTDYRHLLSSQELFELIKIRVKERTIRYCTRRNQINKSKISFLEKQINSLDRQINVTENISNERKNLKCELDQLYSQDSHGIYVRSRAKWIEEGERNTSYFLRLEKKHQTFNNIDKVQNENGDLATNMNDILIECEKFYSNLYQTKNPNLENIEQYLQDTPIHKLNVEDKNICEGIITNAECKNVLKYMKLNKSPGIDGLSTEFYKEFWDDINDTLVQSYNEAFDEGYLSESRNLSVLTLIYKKGDRTLLKNYRPICLSNVDYKIFAFVLANRLQKVINNLVSQDQTGYIKKRYIGTNIRKIIDTIDYLETNNKSGVLLLLDFEKAFDSVEWPFIISTLKQFNFGPQFIKWISIIYNNPKAIIKNNGHLSNKIELHRGIRQGCPISGLIFLLVLEILATRLKENENIKGINIDSGPHTIELKISQFADDTALLLLDENQIEHVFSVVNNFENLAGLKLYVDKTEGLWLGSSKYRQNNCKIMNIKWPTTPIRYLGVFIGYEEEMCFQKNWEEKIISMEKLFDVWKSRDLTTSGKITIIYYKNTSSTQVII